MLDQAHLGDIEGALGRVRIGDTQQAGLKRKLITFLAIVGPGLIVMVGDNDAGGVSTYSQAGQNYGYSLLWTLLLLIPVLIVNQEMVVRLGAVIGASAVTLSTSYAFGDVFGIKHSLHRKFREAKAFYIIYGTMIVVAASIVLIPGTPLGLLTEAVQALAGILLPSASVFLLLLLCNDREVLGPWLNPRWLNLLAGFIIGVLLMLSGTLVVTTLFSNIDASKVAVWISLGEVAGVVIAGAWFWLTRNRRPVHEPHMRTTMSAEERMNWRMPPLALLKPVEWSAGRKLAMLALRGYLVISVLLLIVKAVQLGGG